MYHNQLLIFRGISIVIFKKFKNFAIFWLRISQKIKPIKRIGLNPRNPHEILYKLRYSNDENSWGGKYPRALCMYFMTVTDSSAAVCNATSTTPYHLHPSRILFCFIFDCSTNARQMFNKLSTCFILKQLVTKPAIPLNHPHKMIHPPSSVVFVSFLCVCVSKDKFVVKCNWMLAQTRQQLIQLESLRHCKATRRTLSQLIRRFLCALFHQANRDEQYELVRDRKVIATRNVVFYESAAKKRKWLLVTANNFRCALCVQTSRADRKLY